MVIDLIRFWSEVNQLPEPIWLILFGLLGTSGQSNKMNTLVIIPIICWWTKSETCLSLEDPQTKKAACALDKTKEGHAQTRQEVTCWINQRTQVLPTHHFVHHHLSIHFDHHIQCLHCATSSSIHQLGCPPNLLSPRRLSITIVHHWRHSLTTHKLKVRMNGYDWVGR